MTPIIDPLVPRAQVRVHAPSAFRGYRGTIIKHYPVTGNCLIALATPGTGAAWIKDTYLEVAG